jgi:hypothetical protein
MELVVELVPRTLRFRQALRRRRNGSAQNGKVIVVDTTWRTVFFAEKQRGKNSREKTGGKTVEKNGRGNSRKEIFRTGRKASRTDETRKAAELRESERPPAVMAGVRDPGLAHQ